MGEIRLIPGTISLIKMTDAEYFSEKYSEYISNSKLGLFNEEQGGSFEKYEGGFKEEYSESFELGTAIHSMLLQPDSYHIANINKPSGKLGIFAQEVFKLRQSGLKIKDALTQASINANYYSKQFTDKRIKTAIKGSLDFYLKRIHFQGELDKETIFLSNSLKSKYDECMVSAFSEEVMKILYPEALFQEVEIYNEYAIFCEVEVITDDGEIIRVKLKGKLDNFTINHETETITLNDLKTTGSPIKYFMGNSVIDRDSGERVWYNGSFQKYRYYRQMGMYWWLLQCAIRELYNYEYKSKVNMVVIETIPPFGSKIFPVSNKYITSGLNEFKKLLIELCLKESQIQQELNEK